MRKFSSLILMVLFSTGVLFAGGIVTNTNQSAAWVRWLVRDASTGIDAVYYNPAGLMKLDNGFHLSLSNQFIFQTQTITSDYPFLSEPPQQYTADVKAMFFPDIYAVYKLNKFAFSFGLMPIGGGGSADFSKGTPTFEIPVANLVPMLQGELSQLDQLVEARTGTDPYYRNVSGYSLNSAFNGSSVYLGYQLNVSYAINNMLSLSIGARYVSAKNTYKGHLTDIMINTLEPYGGTQPPGQYLSVIAENLRNSSDPYLQAISGVVAQNAVVLAGMTEDAYVDVEQTGNGITPIIGVNISPTKNLNIGLKYEFATKIELTNKTTVDSIGMFPDGAKSRADLPAMLSAGISYRVLDRLTVQGGFHYYWDKPAYYGKTAVDSLTGQPIVEPDGSFKQVDNRDFMNGNTWELGFGVEYMLMKKLGVSAGYLMVKSGANESYQSDLGYSLSSNTIGGGIVYNFSDKIRLNLGFDYVMYQKDEVAMSEQLSQEVSVDYTNTYEKSTMVFGIGLDISF